MLGLAKRLKSQRPAGRPKMGRDTMSAETEARIMVGIHPADGFPHHMMTLWQRAIMRRNGKTKENAVVIFWLSVQASDQPRPR